MRQNHSVMQSFNRLDESVNMQRRQSVKNAPVSGSLCSIFSCEVYVQHILLGVAADVAMSVSANSFKIVCNYRSVSLLY